MKTVLTFIGLKIMEIIGVVSVWWGLCHLGQWIDVVTKQTHLMPFWIAGFVPIMLFFGIGIILFVIINLGYLLVSKNWEWAKKLSR